MDRTIYWLTKASWYTEKLIELYNNYSYENYKLFFSERNFIKNKIHDALDKADRSFEVDQEWKYRADSSYNIDFRIINSDT